MIENRHRGGVDPLVAITQFFAQDALRYEPDSLVDMPRPRIEGVNLQGNAMQAELLKAVAHDHADGLGTQPPVTAGRTDQGPEIAAAVSCIPLVEHNLA